MALLLAVQLSLSLERGGSEVAETDKMNVPVFMTFRGKILDQF